MYVKAIIKDKDGNQFDVTATSKCDILAPVTKLEQLKYAAKTNALLAKFAWKLRKYANKDHAIVEIQTDNPILAQQFEKQGYTVKLEPNLKLELEQEAKT